MQNQAAVEALYSATFVEDYLDCVENLPNDLQRHLSRLREFDLRQYTVRIFETVKKVLQLLQFCRFYRFFVKLSILSGFLLYLVNEF